MMKQHISSRLFLTAIIALFACVQAMALDLNPFAFKLSSAFKYDTLVVTYYLNAPATNVDIIVDIKNQEPFVVNCNNQLSTQNQERQKGIYNVDIPLRPYLNDATTGELLRNKENLQWSIQVTGGNTEPYITCKQSQNPGQLLNTSIAKSVDFYSAGSVDVNIDPYSETFGDVYVVERRANATTDKAYFSSREGKSVSGVYVFDAAFQNMPVNRNSKDNTFYTFEDGCVSMSQKDHQKAFTFNLNSTSYATCLNGMGYPNMLMQARLVYDTIEEKENVKAHLFASAQTSTGPIFMHGDTEKMDHYGDYDGWSEYVIGGTLEERNNTTEHWLINGGNFIAAPNIMFDIKDDKNGNRQVLMVSGWPGGGLDRTAFRCDEYNLTGTAYGKNGSYSGKIYPRPNITGIFDQNPTYKNCWHVDTWSYGRNNNPAPQPFITSSDVFGVEYDEDGLGFWICQGRDNHSGMPSLTHFMKKQDGKYVVNFIEYWAGRGRDAVRYDNKYERLIVSGGQYHRAIMNIQDNQTSDSKVMSPNNVDHTNKKFYHPAATVGYATIYTINKTQLKTQFIGNISDEQKYAGSQCNSEDRKTLFTDSVYLDLDPNGIDPTTKAYDFAWDYADNLYVAMGYWNKVVVFPLPNGGNPVSTPCKKSEYFSTPTHTLTINISPNNYYCGKIWDADYKQIYTYYLDGARYKLQATDIQQGFRLLQWTEAYPSARGEETSYRIIKENTTWNPQFGIDVFETEAVAEIKQDKITDRTSSVTFPGAFIERELDNSAYNTICLPFDLPSLEDSPWEGATVLKLTNASSSGDEKDPVVALSFEPVSFENGDIMEAGKPYLIKPIDYISSERTVFYGANKAGIICPVIDGKNTYGGKNIEIEVGDTKITFHGVLTPQPTLTNNENTLFLVADNRLANIVGQSTVNLKGLRAFFTVSDPALQGKIELRLPEKTVTSIPTFSIDTMKPTKYLWDGKIYIQRGNNVYDLSGNCVR